MKEFMSSLLKNNTTMKCDGFQYTHFVLASIIGRGGRFFLVAMLLAAGGAKLESKLREYMDRLGWATVALVVIGVGIYKFLHQG